jgi:hypothetical protein
MPWRTCVDLVGCDVCLRCVKTVPRNSLAMNQEIDEVVVKERSVNSCDRWEDRAKTGTTPTGRVGSNAG